jgi:DNA-binding MarR family transcriptional regulator
MSRQEKIESLMNAFLQLKRSMNRQLVETDACPATPVQTEILVRVSKGEVRTADIAIAMHASASAVTQHVNQLVEAGFVKKTESAQDKREQILSLTVSGKHVIDTKLKFMRSRVELLVATLTDQELDQFISISNKIADVKG